MSTLTRTITVLAVLSLLMSGLALAQNVSEIELPDVAAAEAREADVAAREAEIAAREAQRQAGIALVDAEFVAAPEDAARSRLADLARTTLSRTRWPYGSSGVSPVLVIPSGEIETKDLLTINEDINVMSRIFETNLQRARISASGSSLFVTDATSRALFNALSNRGKSPMQSLYLQGYGVLFLLKVDFPLSPPQQTQQQDETEEEEGDKVWQDTRRQLYEPEQVDRRRADKHTVEYDAEKVESLKTTLIKALKHAANIRNLKPEEAAILTITGSGGFAGDPTMIATRRTVVVNGHNRVIQEPAAVAAGSPTVLVIRAKKADIDSFAKGDLDLEQFRQRVQMLSHPYLHGGSQRSDIVNRYGLPVTPIVPSN